MSPLFAAPSPDLPIDLIAEGTVLITQPMELLPTPVTPGEEEIVTIDTLVQHSLGEVTENGKSDYCLLSDPLFLL